MIFVFKYFNIYNEKLIIILIILIILSFFILFKKENFKNKSKKSNIKDPCNDMLYNSDYLTHMIPHHQVAIDMCNLMINISKSKTMLHIYRKIIWNQNIEIMLMKNVVNNIPLLSNENNTIYRDNTFLTSLSCNSKSKPKDYVCDPLYFKPNNHSVHMKHTDKTFLEHMIPHHQVAIVMSNRLLKHTNNTHMIRICYEIITSQRSEILKMNYILEYMNNKKIDFLPNYY